MDHLGTDDTRVFREVADLGEELKKLKDLAGTVAGTGNAAKTGQPWATDGMKGWQSPPVTILRPAGKHTVTCRHFVSDGCDFQ